jgi:hypothetical protein
MKIVDRYNLEQTVKSLTMGKWYEVAIPPFSTRRTPMTLRMQAFQKPDRRGSVVMKNELGGHITVNMNQIVGEAR